MRDWLEDLITKTINKERKKNTGDAGHHYEISCSCGNCHTAFICASAIRRAVKERRPRADFPVLVTSSTGDIPTENWREGYKEAIKDYDAALGIGGEEHV